MSDTYVIIVHSSGPSLDELFQGMERGKLLGFTIHESQPAPPLVLPAFAHEPRPKWQNPAPYLKRKKGRP